MFLSFNVYYFKSSSTETFNALAILARVSIVGLVFAPDSIFMKMSLIVDRAGFSRCDPNQRFGYHIEDSRFFIPDIIGNKIGGTGDLLILPAKFYGPSENRTHVSALQMRCTTIVL